MKRLIKTKGIILLLLVLFLVIGYNNQPVTTTGKEISNPKDTMFKVTFIELGSVRCIPCQKMQPVMKSIEQKYGTKVKVVFHDVWNRSNTDPDIS
jgi:thiol-disulfide isomerase/thioredoxin